ncbi:MAG TPA: ATP-binding protein, partial [Nannocystaceae bacterium]|nr:ATP-binding protein [Nannocystaceae bacterium]
AADASMREPVAWVRTIVISFLAIGLFGALVVAIVDRLERSLELARAETVRRELAERERADAEIALLQNRQLETIGRMAAGVAHDFNNNLTAIIGCAELLRMDLPETSEERTLAGDILQAAQHAAELTGQLLAYSRNAQMVLVPTDVHALVASAVSLVARSADRRIEIESELACARPIVHADPSLLQNALLNLLVNAIDAMPEGGKLRIGTSDRTFTDTDSLPPGHYMIVEVRDDGAGIAPEILPRIFEPFFSTKVARKGTGLGLAGVAAAANALGGAITVDSELGRGSVFRLRLPLADAAVTVPAASTEALVRGHGRVLVVDDEPLVRGAAIALLRSLGYEVTPAADGSEAVAIVERTPDAFDLVLLDVRMPKLRGQQSLAALLRVAPKLRVLMWSGHVAEDELVRMLEQGAVGFVPKPYRAAQLSRTIADVLARPS